MLSVLLFCFVCKALVAAFLWHPIDNLPLQYLTKKIHLHKVIPHQIFLRAVFFKPSLKISCFCSSPFSKNALCLLITEPQRLDDLVYLCFLILQSILFLIHSISKRPVQVALLKPWSAGHSCRSKPLTLCNCKGSGLAFLPLPALSLRPSMPSFSNLWTQNWLSA